LGGAQNAWDERGGGAAHNTARRETGSVYAAGIFLSRLLGQIAYQVNPGSGANSQGSSGTRRFSRQALRD